MDESVVWWVQGKVIPYMSDYYSAPVSELLGGVACGRVLLLACVADFDCSATIQTLVTVYHRKKFTGGRSGRSILQDFFTFYRQPMTT